MVEFIIFYAPFIILIAAIIVAFLIAPLDKAVNKED